uniref:Uncharacterized protein n=1 Tax=Anguilla anguilla TaxID=7936 RepID=A0A0E9W930_ANGAN
MATRIQSAACNVL